VLPGLLEPPLHPRAPAHDLRRPVSRGLIGVAVAVAAVTASVAFGCILMCSHNAIAWLSALLSRFHLCLRSCARVCIQIREERGALERDGAGPRAERAQDVPRLGHGHLPGLPGQLLGAEGSQAAHGARAKAQVGCPRSQVQSPLKNERNELR